MKTHNHPLVSTLLLGSLGLAALSLFGPACTVEDADLTATAALLDLEAEASTDNVVNRTSLVTGTVRLGYTSSQQVDLRILDNSLEVFAGTFPADSHQVPFEAPIDLLFEGPNELTVEATYNGQVVSTSTTVTVPDGLMSFLLAPDAESVGGFEVNVSRTAELGYLSDQPVVLEIRVNGDDAYSETYSALESTSIAIDAVLPLTELGENDVVAELTYQDATYTTSFDVDVVPPPPTVTFPTWQLDYQERVRMEVTGDVIVTPAAGWSTEQVVYSTDGGATWSHAVLTTGDAWEVTIVNPDIGEHPALFEVTSSNRGIPVVTPALDLLAVDPVFDCADPAGSMIPDNDLIQDNGNEIRTMVGYFGDPGAGHTVTFVIDADVPNDGPYTVVGGVVRYGPMTIDVDFDINRLRCNNDPCWLSYDLEVYVDGTHQCSRANFGDIRNY